ncbi:MAG: hypothetical protein JWM63_9 [Gammaproteobacteria bacterium]|jgi:hypothetical protein|nr:hypothetical protein [Gammaproteobacteria bacterium]
MVVVIAIAVVIPIMAIMIMVFLVAIVPTVVSTVVAVIGADDAARQRDNARGQYAGCQDVQWFHRGLHERRLTHARRHAARRG